MISFDKLKKDYDITVVSKKITIKWLKNIMEHNGIRFEVADEVNLKDDLPDILILTKISSKFAVIDAMFKDGVPRVVHDDYIYMDKYSFDTLKKYGYMANITADKELFVTENIEVK